jgi:hypothetical protein
MNMLMENYLIHKLSRAFSDYEPLQVTRESILKWLRQYSKDDQILLIKLLNKIIYYSEEKVDIFLKEKNQELLDKLNKEGFDGNKVIYMTLDDAGSSSQVILSKLKNFGHLERKKCKFLYSQDIIKINTVVKNIGSGAIVYVDDFAGTGNQFCEERDRIVDNIPLVSNFSEFFLAVCVCEEAKKQLDERGIEIITDHIHTISERVLHPENKDNIFTIKERERLIKLSSQINPKKPLGYSNLASMVVMYRNAPNNTPVILRGNIGQNKFVGVLPRTTDF